MALENAQKVSEEHSPEKEAGHGIQWKQKYSGQLDWGIFPCNFYGISLSSVKNSTFHLSLGYHVDNPAYGDDCIIKRIIQGSGCPCPHTPAQDLVQLWFTCLNSSLRCQSWCWPLRKANTDASLLCCISSKILAAIWEEDGEKPLYAAQNIVYAIFYVQNSTKHLFYQKKKKVQKFYIHH